MFNVTLPDAHDFAADLTTLRVADLVGVTLLILAFFNACKPPGVCDNI